jgi:hypothetical protein
MKPRPSQRVRIRALREHPHAKRKRWVSALLPPVVGIVAVLLSLRFATAVDEGETMDCDAVEVRWTNPVGGTATLLVERRDEIVHVVRGGSVGEFLSAQWCGDLLSDGTTVLVFDRYSGGAHCCTTVQAIQLDANPIVLLTADVGNGPSLSPRQLDGVGPLELRGRSDLFSNFGKLSYAASPFLPLVYRYTGGGYVEATRGFRGVIHRDLSEAWKQLRKIIHQESANLQDVAGTSLWVLSDYLLLGDAKRGLARLMRESPPTIDRWLANHLGQIEKAITRAYR